MGFSNNGNVCPFCTDADPKWPDRYMVPTYFNKRRGAHVPSPRYRSIVSVTCKNCGAKWSRDTRKWERAHNVEVVLDTIEDASSKEQSP